MQYITPSGVYFLFILSFAFELGIILVNCLIWNFLFVERCGCSFGLWGKWKMLGNFLRMHNGAMRKVKIFA